MLNYSILATDGEIGQVSDVLVGDVSVDRTCETHLHDYYGYPYSW